MPRHPVGTRATPGRRGLKPRAPCGARRVEVCGGDTDSMFQSTRPVRGATLVRTMSASSSASFNPRAPCGARPRPTTGSTSPCWVSIHAPRAGRDVCHDPALLLLCRVSIHAPRAGRDPPRNRGRCRAWRFNPRAPCGARRGHIQQRGHVPRVSIHAPRAGRDPSRVGPRRRPLACFNPRAPCGARHNAVALNDHVGEFQSTRPVRGATGKERVFYDCHMVSIHAPRAGRDSCIIPRRARTMRFQSTRPVRGATSDFLKHIYS